MAFGSTGMDGYGNASGYESNRSQEDSHTNHNKLNVAHVCTGLAFELAYKSLLVQNLNR